MQISAEQRKKLNLALERLLLKVREVKKAHPEVKLGETEAPSPEGYVEDDPLRVRGSVEWAGYLNPENEELDKVMLEILSTFPQDRSGKNGKAHRRKSLGLGRTDTLLGRNHG